METKDYVVALRLFTTTLKNLAVELNSFILTSTQLSNLDSDDGGFKDFKHIQGSRAIVNLVDFACIMAKPTKQDLTAFGEFSSNFNCTPNLVIDIFKNRRGRWNNVRIWSINDLGCCRREDLCLTTSNLKIIEDFTIYDFQQESNENTLGLILNFEYLMADKESKTDVKPLEVEQPEITAAEIKDAFHNQNDVHLRYANKGVDELI